MNKDYAIIFQKFEHEEVEYYLPIDVTEGIYLEKNNTFTAHNVTLKHIVAGEDYGYCNRENITALINKHKYMPMFIAKKIILNELRTAGAEAIAINNYRVLNCLPWPFRQYCILLHLIQPRLWYQSLPSFSFLCRRDV